MLHLTAIRAEGLKGQTMDEQLEGCDVFVGPNGSGKTTRLLAVDVAVRGPGGKPTDLGRSSFVELVLAKDGDQ